MATKRINNGIHTIELASGDFAVATAAVDSTGAAVVPGAVTVADGADAAQGAKADVAWVSGSGSEIAILKAIAGLLPGTGATNLGKAEDAAGVSGDTGVFMLAVRDSAQSTPPAGTDGDYSQITVNPLGQVLVAAGAYNGSAGGDAVTGLIGLGRRDQVNSTSNPFPLFSAPGLFNNTGYDRQRGNVDQTVGITAAGVTSTQTGADQTNFNGRGVIVVLDMTIIGTGNVTLEIDGKDLSSGKYYALLTGAAVASNSTNVYILYPGVAAVANAAVSMGLPRTWRVKVTANNANATTYTVSASVLL